MTLIRFQSTQNSNQTIELECDEGVSVLDALLAANVKIPHSCRAGLCQACLCQTNDISTLNPEAVEGLSNLQRRSNQFLACQCIPARSLEVCLPDHNSDWLSELVGKRYLSDSIVELSFQAEGRWDPGQHVLLWMDDIHARPYSASNVYSATQVVSFLVRRHPQGLLSRWCYDQLEVGERVRMSSPQGHFCLGQEVGNGVVAIAQGSGLGVAVGLSQQALTLESEVCVDLFWVGDDVQADDSKAQSAFEDLEPSRPLLSYFTDRLDGVTVHQRDHDESCSGAAGPASYVEAQELLGRSGVALRGKKIFIVGGERFVTEMSRVCFFSGAARTDIVTEVFLCGNGDDHL